MAPRARLIGSLAIVALAALAGFGAYAWSSRSTTQTTDAQPGGAAPFQIPVTASVAQVPTERIRVEATSFLQPIDGITYNPGNTIDGDVATAWNSAEAANDGRGQTITYRFSHPVDLRALRFVNGYAKNADVYNSNHRIQDVIVTTDAGSQRVSLLDTSDRQEIAHEFGMTSKVVLEVVEVYVGAGFNDPALTADLALTEVGFLAAQTDS